jgi:uncharacterized membrane protein
MGDYLGRLMINRPAAAVFGFLADTANMPHYLPTVRQVSAKGGNRLLLQGEADGHPWQAEGWLEVEPQHRRMRWGSEAPAEYRGELHVAGGDDHAEVELRLHLQPLPEVAQRMAQQAGSVEAGLRQAVEHTLEAIRQALEGSPQHRLAEPTSRLYGHTATMNTDLT